MKYCFKIINVSHHTIIQLYKPHENDIHLKRITNNIVCDIKCINAKLQICYMHSAIRGRRTHSIYYRLSDEFIKAGTDGEIV